jgi:DNA-binding PadR family transcriptional regulator
MKRPDVPLLGYALLGLIDLKPSSGYDLRKVFAETAIGNYSSSPGAIYPALERLESQRLIRGVVEDSAGLRRRRIYHSTSAGTAELKRWLAKSIRQEDVMRGAPELMLRFSFMEHRLSSEAAVNFLQEFRAGLKTYLSGLESYARGNAKQMPLSGRLALESGIRGYRGMYDWTAYAIRAYRQAKASRNAPRGLKSARRIINRGANGATEVVP